MSHYWYTTKWVHNTIAGPYTIYKDRAQRDADLPSDVQQEHQELQPDDGGVRMLPEQIARMLSDEDRKRITAKLDSALSSDYYYSRSKTEMLMLIAEIGELMYRKGRSDEKYFNGGPMISIYDKE